MTTSNDTDTFNYRSVRLPAQAKGIAALPPSRKRERTKAEKAAVAEHDRQRLEALRHICPECGQPFQRKGNRQVFCSPEHKQAFANRITTRGKTLVPLAMAHRIRRGGSDHAKRARGDMTAMLDKWAAEDFAAGRMSMEDYEFLKFTLGYAA